MLTLKEIFKGHNYNEEVERVVLFEEGLWCLYERIPMGWHDNRFNIIHRCSVSAYALELDRTDDETYNIHCQVCREKPDYGILGLLALHAWGMGEDPC